MKAKVIEATSGNLAIVAQAIRSGQVVGMPTETVYGLAGDLFQEGALARIFDTKERPKFDPLIAHVAAPEGKKPSLALLSEMNLIDAARIPDAARPEAERLIRAFWPGPLTLVLPKSSQVPDLATSGLATVAVRMPSHPVAQALLRASGTALAAPSANRFGRISPTTAQAVVEELGDRVEWILDGGACSVGVESTIVAPHPKGWRLLRPGGTPTEALEEELGHALVKADHSAGAPEAPGMMESHYAPRKPLAILPKPLKALSDSQLKHWLEAFELPRRIGLLLMSGETDSSAKRLELASGARVDAFVLSPTGDLPEAASNLFSTLRTLDRSDCGLLLAEPCDSTRGLGHAIADRLKRAAAPKGKS
jgi:L-threonylcarbamoyladenylate synthase